MLLSGYHLGIHLLNSTDEKVTLQKGPIVKSESTVRIYEGALEGKDKRNSVFTVKYLSGIIEQKFFVKQPSFPFSNSISSIRNEEYILSLFSQIYELKNHAHLVSYDPYQKFIFENFVDGKFLEITKNYEDVTIQDLLSKVAVELSMIHSVDENFLIKNNLENNFGYRKPLFLNIEKRDVLDLLADNNLSGYQKKILTLLKENRWALFERLKKIKWEASSLIHFDLKIEHLILNSNNQLSIIDWEMGDMGDRYWDLASLFFEIIKMRSSNDKAVVDTLAETISLFKSFGLKYNFDCQKLGEYVLLVAITQSYFNLFQSLSFSEEFEKALLEEIQKLNFQATDDSFIIVDLKFIATAVPENHEEDTSHRNIVVDTRTDLTDLIDKIVQANPKPSSFLEYKSFIYKWFNGYSENVNERQELLDNREEVAVPATIGKEEFKEDLYWQIEKVANINAVVIRKNSEKRLAYPGTFIYTKDILKHSPLLGIEKPHVKVIYPSFIVRPNDTENISTDLWLMPDNQIRQDSSNWLRIYFNLEAKLEGIYYFIETISRLLNERSIGYDLKLRNRLSSYYRSDVVVLFIHRNHYVAVFDILVFMYHSLKEKKYLNDKKSPKLTFRFRAFEGMAFGENPIDDSVSFGNFRAELLSLYFIHCDFTKTSIQLKNDLEQYLENNNFIPHKMYRNPYPIKSEYKYLYSFLMQKLKDNDKPNFEIDAHDLLKYNSQKKYLLAARHIGFIICKEAVWFGQNSCNWFSFEKEGRTCYFTTLDKKQKKGIAIFLAALFKYFPEDFIFYDCVKAALNKSRLKRDYNTLYKEANVQSDKLFSANQKTFDSNGNISSFYLKDFMHVDDNSRFLANTLIERFIDKKLPFPNAYASGWNDPLANELNFTLSHGLSGLGYFFLEVGSGKTLKPRASFY